MVDQFPSVVTCYGPWSTPCNALMVLDVLAETNDMTPTPAPVSSQLHNKTIDLTARAAQTDRMG